MYPVTRLTSFLLFAGFCFATPASALEHVTLQLKWTHQFQFAGYYAALEKGYYREAGLDVQLKEANPDTDTVAEIVSGNTEFGVGSSNLILARATGKPVVTLAVIFQRSPYVIFAAKDKGINKLSDLAGKRIMLDDQSGELMLLLKRSGLQKDSFTLIKHSQNPQDLIDGKVDAISGYVSTKPYFFQRADFAYQTFSPLAAGIDFYGDNLFTSEQELQAHPERVQAFTEASLRGWRYARDHRDEIINLIASKYAKQKSHDFLEFEAEQMIPLLQPDLIDIGYSNPSRWQHIAEAYADAGLLPHDIRLDGFLYTPPNDGSLLHHSVEIFLLLLVLIGAGAILIYFIYRKIHSNLKQLETARLREQARTLVLELLANGAPLPEILNAVVKSVEIEDTHTRCSILIMDKDGKHLNVAAAPSLPDFYSTAINGLAIGPNVGSCGASAYFGKRTIVENILTHPSWEPYKELATSAGLGSCWSEPIISSTGKVLGTFAIYHKQARYPTSNDIELIERAAHLAKIAIEKNQAEQSLLQNNYLLSKISAEVPGIIFQFRLYPDGRSCFPFISEAVRRMYGLTPEDLREDATPFFGFRHPEDAARLAASVEESARNLTRWHIEYRLILPSQGMRWRLGDAQPERLEDGSILWHGFITDITERKNTEERIRHMAQYDALTDLPNRALFSDRLQRALAIAKRGQNKLALLFLDFDKFKPINDSLGHAVGDLLLQSAAKRMQECMRGSDSIARIGGDEFVVLLPNVTGEQDALLVAEKIRQAIEKPFELGGHALEISTSIGIAIYPRHGEDEIELAKHADLAMYYAKQNGRNTVMVYHHNMKVAGQ